MSSSSSSLIIIYFFTDKQQEVDLHALRTQPEDQLSSHVDSAAAVVRAKASASKALAAKAAVGNFGGVRSPELQSLYKVKGLTRDLSQPSTFAGDTVPRFGVTVADDKEEELAEVRTRNGSSFDFN